MWLQHNFPRLGRWRSLTPYLSNCNSHPIPDSPRRSTLHPATCHKSPITAFFHHPIVGGDLKKEEERGRRKRESSKICAIWKNNHLTPIYMEKRMIEITIATCFITTPSTDQAQTKISEQNGQLYTFNVPLLYKVTFNIYLEKRLRITWGETRKW